MKSPPLSKLMRCEHFICINTFPPFLCFVPRPSKELKASLTELTSKIVRQTLLPIHISMPRKRGTSSSSLQGFQKIDVRNALFPFLIFAPCAESEALQSSSGHKRLSYLNPGFRTLRPASHLGVQDRRSRGKTKGSFF